MIYRLFRYIDYWFTSSHKKGHGIHSPFLYEFITKVLNDKTYYSDYKEIEKIRTELKKNKQEIEVSNFGAKQHVDLKKTVSKIYRQSSINRKYGQLLYRIVRFYKPSNILELGTCLGISTLYLSKANSEAKIITIEGSVSYSIIAKEVFDKEKIENVYLINNNFDTALPELLKNKYDLFYIDGNHTFQSTINYFQLLLNARNDMAIMIFDDINWSRQMNKAWKEIIKNNAINLSIDLYRFGILFFNENIYGKLHYKIRF